MSAACGEVLLPADTPDAAVAPNTSDAAAACDPSERQLRLVEVTTDAGTCCGGSLAALGDGSGLAAGKHDCDDATMWKSNGRTNGELTIDLGAEHELTGMTIWNSGQLDGARGARSVQLLHSRNNASYFQIPGAPSVLARPAACPNSGQSFSIAGVRARFVRLEVLNTYGATNIGIGEIAISGRPICE